MADKKWTDNEAIEMMHSNTAKAFKSVANYARNHSLSKKEIIDFLIETAEEMEAQAIVVKNRDELGYKKPVDDTWG